MYLLRPNDTSISAKHILLGSSLKIIYIITYDLYYVKNTQLVQLHSWIFKSFKSVKSIIPS